MGESVDAQFFKLSVRSPLPARQQVLVTLPAMQGYITEYLPYLELSGRRNLSAMDMQRRQSCGVMARLFPHFCCEPCLWHVHASSAAVTKDSISLKPREAPISR